MITRSPIYNVARSLTSRQYEFIEREFGYSKTSFLDLPDETLVDIYYDLCEIEATALTRKGNLTSRGKKAAELAELFGDVIAVNGSYYWDGDDDFSDYDDYYDRVEEYDPEDAYGHWDRDPKDFPLFSNNSTFTDDTVMTIAVAEAFMNAPDDEKIIHKRLIQSMQKWGHRYPGAGYGLRFSDWLDSDDPQPYNSWGNGSAMRVSSIAWLYDDLDTVRRMARLSAEVTHNHPEGIKGAEATASAIFLVRIGSSNKLSSANAIIAILPEM